MISLVGPCEQWSDWDTDSKCALVLNMLIKMFLKKQSKIKSIDSLYRKLDRTGSVLSTNPVRFYTFIYCLTVMCMYQHTYGVSR